jgi:hypothetical protein
MLALNLLLRRLAFNEFALGVAALLCARWRDGKRRQCGYNQTDFHMLKNSRP